MIKDGSGPGSRDHLTIVKSLFLNVFVILLAAVHPSESQEKAARKLIEAIEDGKITTPGYFRGLCKKLFVLPSGLKTWVWIRLFEKIDKTDWAELRHKNAEIERELQQDLEARLEHLEDWRQ